MPYTAQQRKLFHAAAEDAGVAREHNMSAGDAKRMADEADRLARKDREKASAKKAFLDLSAVLEPATDRA